MRKIIQTIGILFFLTGLLLGCGPEKEEQQPEEEEFYLPDTINTDGMAFVLTPEDKACLSRKDAICEYGLYFVSLGLPMDEIGFAGEQAMAGDTLFTAGGYQWRGKVIDYGPEGSVTIEGDFVDEGDPAGKLPFTRVNRIRVESSLFQAGGVQVGNPFAALAENYPDSLFQAIYLPEYQMVDVSLPGISRIHYNVKDEQGLIGATVGNQLARIPVDLIPEEAPIASIVVTM